MGDLRGTWRELVGPLVEAGFRVAVTDLRGHGDADTTFTEHGDIATAGDILALIDELGGPALVLGNSMAGSAAVIAAAAATGCRGRPGADQPVPAQWRFARAPRR